MLLLNADILMKSNGISNAYLYAPNPFSQERDRERYITPHRVGVGVRVRPLYVCGWCGGSHLDHRCRATEEYEGRCDHCGAQHGRPAHARE